MAIQHLLCPKCSTRNGTKIVCSITYCVCGTIMLPMLNGTIKFPKAQKIAMALVGRGEELSYKELTEEREKGEQNNF